MPSHAAEFWCLQHELMLPCLCTFTSFLKRIEGVAPSRIFETGSNWLPYVGWESTSADLRREVAYGGILVLAPWVNATLLVHFQILSDEHWVSWSYSRFSKWARIGFRTSVGRQPTVCLTVYCHSLTYFCCYGRNISLFDLILDG